MESIKGLIMAAAISVAAVAGIGVTAQPAHASEKSIIQPFYDYLSNPGSEAHKAKFVANTAADWRSVGDYSGRAKSRDQFVKQMGGFAKLIPDLTWKVEEMLQDGNRVVVRSRATGTPKGPLFGVDGKGRGFDILTIDIHTLDDDKIVQTYHVEDWSGALRQLSGK